MDSIFKFYFATDSHRCTQTYRELDFFYFLFPKKIKYKENILIILLILSEKLLMWNGFDLKKINFGPQRNKCKKDFTPMEWDKKIPLGRQGRQD